MTDNATICAELVGFPTVEQLAPLAPGAEVNSDPEAGLASIRWADVALSLMRMPNDQMGGHLQGLLGQVRSSGGSEALCIRLLGTLSVFSLVIEPEFDPAHRAMRFIAGMTSAADGLCLLADGEIRDAEGRRLLRGEGLAPPDAARVARRALLQLGLARRGLLEEDAGGSREAEAWQEVEKLQAWLDAQPGCLEEAEAEERAALEAPFGKVPAQTLIDSIWRAEGAQVLLWALSARQLPPHDAQEHPSLVGDDLGMGQDGVAALLQAPVLRPEAKIDWLRRRLLVIHWRLREATLRPGARDLHQLAAPESWYGGCDLEGLPLSGSDLTLDGQPIRGATPDRLELVTSIALERHTAANWLMGCHPLYSRVNAAT